MNNHSAEDEWNKQQLELLHQANRNTKGKGAKAAYREAERLLEEINCPKDMRSIKRKFREVIKGHHPALASSTGRKLRPSRGEQHPSPPGPRYILPQLTGQVRHDTPSAREPLVQTVERLDGRTAGRRSSQGRCVDANTTTGLPSPRQTLGDESTTASGGDDLPLSHVNANDEPASHQMQSNLPTPSQMWSQLALSLEPESTGLYQMSPFTDFRGGPVVDPPWTRSSPALDSSTIEVVPVSVPASSRPAVTVGNSGPERERGDTAPVDREGLPDQQGRAPSNISTTDLESSKMAQLALQASTYRASGRSNQGAAAKGVEILDWVARLLTANIQLDCEQLQIRKQGLEQDLRDANSQIVQLEKQVQLHECELAQLRQADHNRTTEELVQRTERLKWLGRCCPTASYFLAEAYCHGCCYRILCPTCVFYRTGMDSSNLGIKPHDNGSGCPWCPNRTWTLKPLLEPLNLLPVSMPSIDLQP